MELNRATGHGMISTGTSGNTFRTDAPENRLAAMIRDGVMRFAPDLTSNLAYGDASYLSMLDAADSYVAREGLDLPEEPAARAVEPDPECVTDPILALNLQGAGIEAIVWATGYALDFGWLKVDAFDDAVCNALLDACLAVGVIALAQCRTGCSH